MTEYKIRLEVLTRERDEHDQLLEYYVDFTLPFVPTNGLRIHRMLRAPSALNVLVNDLIWDGDKGFFRIPLSCYSAAFDSEEMGLERDRKSLPHETILLHGWRLIPSQGPYPPWGVL